MGIAEFMTNSQLRFREDIGDRSRDDRGHGELT